MNLAWKHLICIATGLMLAISLSALADSPTTEPLPRLETGMHTAPIKRIATDSAGRWAVTASDDKTVRVWEVATGRQVMVLRPPQGAGNEGRLHAMAMSPDGERVAVGGWTGLDWEGKASIYLFDRASGRLRQRIAGLPNVIHHLAWSPDGRWLAATLGEGGLRLYDAASGAESGQDASYGDNSYSAHFSPNGSRLVTTCLDGQMRLYALESGEPRLLKAVRLEGGKHPFNARFSPDGRAIAVVFGDSTAVQVLDASTLTETARPTTAGVDNGSLSSVAWSADGRRLLATGSWDVAEKFPVRSWTVGDWSHYRDQPLTNNTVMDLVPLPDGNLLFAAAGSTWGVLDQDGQVLRRRDGGLADLRGQTDQLRLSADGRRVRFGYHVWGKDIRVFDLAQRALGNDDPSLAVARTTAPGLEFANWENKHNPSLNSRPLALGPYETSRSLAIAADGRHFALGAEWHLRLYDRAGNQVWQQAMPSAVWAVNISADNHYVVAGYADGTIRWHRFSDGREVLALFPHADQKRWVAWTPEGYFDASPGTEDLMGYHLNQGADKEGQFVSARQLWETFYQPGLIAHRLDADGDTLLAAMVKRRGDIRQLLATAQPPELELLSPAQDQSSGEYRLKFKVKQPGHGQGRLVIRVDGQEISGRWTAPPLTPGGVVEQPVDLAEGRHEVSAELVDKRGIASAPVRATVKVSRPVGAEAATLHVLAVGVSNYRDGDLRLKYAAADTTAIAQRFKQRGAPLFQGRVVLRTLLDRDATADKIGKTLAEMAAKARPEDTFVLFMAGHGTTLDDEYYFMPWELDYENDAALRKQAISQTRLREWLSRLPTRSLLLLDTCRAGNIAQLASRAGEDKNALAKLIRISQRNVIVASSADRIALEGYQGHGVFSWVVLDALLHADYDSNGQVDVSEIAMHVRKHVPVITERMFNYRQVPMQDTPGEPFAVAVPEGKEK